MTGIFRQPSETRFCESFHIISPRLLSTNRDNGPIVPQCVIYCNLFGCGCPRVPAIETSAGRIFSDRHTPQPQPRYVFSVIFMQHAATTRYLHIITSPPWFFSNHQHPPGLTISRTAQAPNFSNVPQIAIPIIIYRRRPLCRGHWSPGVRFRPFMALLSR